MRAKPTYRSTDNMLYGYSIDCPGCNDSHTIITNPVYAAEVPAGPCWTFNGNVDLPTFRASLLVRTGTYADPNYEPDAELEKEWPSTLCHSFITDGNIQFLTDCTHHLAGQTVELPELA